MFALYIRNSLWYRPAIPGIRVRVRVTVKPSGPPEWRTGIILYTCSGRLTYGYDLTCDLLCDWENFIDLTRTAASSTEAELR